MPWGEKARRRYHRCSESEPANDTPWLADWNGGLIWSGQAQAVTATGLRGKIEQRLCQAFDPNGLFGGAPA